MNDSNSDNAYRQFEVDLRDGLDRYLDLICKLDINPDEKVTLEFSESKFVCGLSDNEFLEACHLIASPTKSQEGNNYV